MDAYSPSNGVAIVTDSTCDLPGELVEKYHIHVIPNLIVIDGQSMVDGEQITRESFYAMLPRLKTLPTTATASSGSYLSIYQIIFDQGCKNIISLHPSSLLSGIYNAARIAAQAFDGKVRVVDTGQVSMGLGFQVLAAAEAAARGASIDQLMDLIGSVRSRIHLLAMLDTLEYIRRSGRVSWARARLGDLLHIKPIIELREGRVFSLGEARTFKKGIKRLEAYLTKLGPLERLAILHSNAEAAARQFFAGANLDLPAHPLFVNVTTIIGTHVGPNGVGFTAVVA